MVRRQDSGAVPTKTRPGQREDEKKKETRQNLPNGGFAGMHESLLSSKAF